MHFFDPNVAADYGITEAVIINHFQFWIGYNKRSGRNENDGRTWSYQSNKSLTEAFPYLSSKSIWGAIDRLTKAGVLMKGNFNAHKYDRTLWYAFVLEDFWIQPVGKFHYVKKENVGSTSGEPIPDDSTDNVPDNNSTVPNETVPQPEKPKNQKGEKKEPDKDWKRWVERWDVFYKNRHDDMPPMFNGAQLGPSGLKGIRKHLTAVATKVDGKSADDCGYLAWDYMLNHWDDMGDQFLQSQFDLTVVLKKINDILNRLKNATTATNRGANSNGFEAQPTGTSAQRLKAMHDY